MGSKAAKKSIIPPTPKIKNHQNFESSQGMEVNIKICDFSFPRQDSFYPLHSYSRFLLIMVTCCWPQVNHTL